jgi:hypothetical protein
MAVGLGVYFAYSWRHSRVGRKEPRSAAAQEAARS